MTIDRKKTYCDFCYRNFDKMHMLPADLSWIYEFQPEAKQISTVWCFKVSVIQPRFFAKEALQSKCSSVFFGDSNVATVSLEKQKKPVEENLPPKSNHSPPGLCGHTKDRIHLLALCWNPMTYFSFGT